MNWKIYSRLLVTFVFAFFLVPIVAQSIPAGYVQTTATIPSLADGTLGAAWTNLSSSPQLGLLGCVSTFQNTVNGNFDAYGHIAVLLADTSQICPAPSTWTFTLTFACPVGYPVSAFMLQVAVTGGGGTEDISSQISAVLPPKPCGGGPSTGVLSVGLTLPSSVFSVNGSPVTSIGTLAGAFVAQAAGTVFAGPASGDPAIPTFRPIAPGDVPCGAGGINQLTGDATAGPGCETQALTLATVNSTPGTCGDSTDVCQVTTNSKGLTTHQAAIPISLSNAFTLSPTPPLSSGQYIVLYPNSVSPAGTVNCINVPVVAGIGAAASTSPYSGTVTRYASGVLPGCPGDIANTWSGATLPSGISPTNVTSVYGGMIYQTYCTLNNINHCGDLNIYSNGTQIFTSASTFPQSTITHLLASGSPAQTYDFAATTWEADSDSSAEYALNQPFGAQGWFQPFLIVYYTGTPITPPNQVLIAPPLQFNQNTLSLPLPFDSIVDNGSVNAYNSTLPGLTFLIAGTHVWLQALNSNTSTTPTFQLNGTGFYTIEGPTGAALSAGDISNLHTASLVYDLDGNWRLLNPQVSGGSGGSGFPITLGSTSIAASSTTTALTGISINGVTLNNAGSSSLFLNQAGGYSAPPGSGTVSSVSSGNLTPLFTVSVANPTSTPAFTFTLSNAAANTVFANCTGSTAAPSYCALTTAMLPAIAGNTVLGNGTASSAAPTALAMPSCSGASNALTWTTSSGFGCNTISGGSGSSGYLGTLTLSSSRNATASDCGYIIELAGFTYTLPNSALVCGSGTTPLGIAVQDTTTSNTIALAASATYNTGSTGPTLPQNYLCSIWSTSSAGVYQGCIPPVAGSNVTVTAAANEYTIAASGSTIPSNAAFIYAGISVNDDDEQVLSPSVSITGWTTTGGVTTVTNSGTNNFVTNQWVSMRFATGWSFCPSGEALGTGCSLFQVLSSGLSSTQFEISTSAISAGSCASSCGVAHSAMSYLPFATSSAGTFPSAALSNTVVFIPNPVNISGLASNYATFIHPLRPSVTGKPTYLIINNPNNDAASCTAASTIEGYYNTIFADAHTDGITVVVGTPTGTYWNQFGLGCSTAYTIQATVDSWLRAEGKAAVLANSSTSTQYWDIVSDLGSILYDGSNTNNIVAANSGLAPAGADIAARRLSMDIFNATGTLLPKSIWYGVQNGSGFANVTGNVYAPFADGPMYQWLNASRTAVEMALNTGLGYLQVASKLSIDGCSNGGSWQLCLNGSVTGTFYVDADANVGTSGNVSAGGYVNAGSYDISGSAAATTINSTNCNLGGSCTIATTTNITVGSTNVPSPVFNSTTPAAPSGAINDVPQSSSSNVSFYTPAATGSTPGVIKPDGTTCTVTSGILTCTGSTGSTSIPICADTSGSGTAQSCTTSPSFTPVAGTVIAYTTSTANTGTGLTINVNSLGAKSVAKWQNTTTLAANDIRANAYMLLTYDGTNWETSSVGNAPSGAVTQIGQVVVSGSTTTSMTFSSIPATYTSLKLICFGRSSQTAASEPISIQYNGDTSSHYTVQYVQGTGSAATSAYIAATTSAAVGNFAAASAPSGSVGSVTIEIPNYSQTTFNKQAVVINFSTFTGSSAAILTVGHEWSSTAAINAIAFNIAAGDFVAGSTCTLYGEL